MTLAGTAFAQDTPPAAGRVAPPQVGIAKPIAATARATCAGKLVKGRCLPEAFPELAGDKTRPALESLKTDLVGVDAEKAKMAAKRLARLATPPALSALLDALALGLDPEVAVVAVAAVGYIRNPAAIDVLAGYAHHRQTQVRARAVWALGQIDDAKALKLAYAAFGDGDKDVRAAACKVAEDRRDGSQSEALINLLLKGDEASAPALAAIATPDLARKLGELFGQAPDNLLAKTLGLMVLRPDLGKEDVYVELIKTIAKIPGEEAIMALSNFISKTPENPPRAARKEAQAQYDQRLSGGAK